MENTLDAAVERSGRTDSFKTGGASGRLNAAA